MTLSPARPRVAVVGSGISGLTAAYVLRRTHDVTVFEADDRAGGHAHTHTVADGARSHRVDSGFIVHNDRTYPLLRRLFAELDVPVRPTEMSMSIRCDGCGLEYAGGRGLSGLFAQPRRLADPRFLRMLLDVKRFQRAALALLDAPQHDAEPQTYGDFLREHGFGAYFVDHYAIPVVACVWSSGLGTALEYPARYLFEFLRHHGFLSITGSPQWFTVAGGSRTYVDKVAEAVGDVRVGSAVRHVTRKPDGIELVDAHDRLHVADQVVIATHADDALAMLTDPSDAEAAALGAFGYSRNETVLHRDPAPMPRARRAHASWNYRTETCSHRASAPAVTYAMDRLQGLDADRPFLVTLNDVGRIDPAAIEARMTYAHPVYTVEAVAAQDRVRALFTDRTVFAGAHLGWGFHEDGCRSGVEAARALGADWGDA
ncbi:NAD(P)/FAD-dependent oxidoreductase [Aeromicrobium massiliense]|uniref:NAD(P)/FAD-dependent oxidoreductase n=1 Tax=Aeromicrobium massiliense TaxID=1464554 RepID=UPI0002EAB38D|nr:FAD-dependent oxidoreductase [Aeromicrobium massiliense]